MLMISGACPRWRRFAHHSSSISPYSQTSSHETETAASPDCTQFVPLGGPHAQDESQKDDARPALFCSATKAAIRKRTS
jgi:hypothetical protein